jgi:hypothetical protein
MEGKDDPRIFCRRKFQKPRKLIHRARPWRVTMRGNHFHLRSIKVIAAPSQVNIQHASMHLCDHFERKRVPSKFCIGISMALISRCHPEYSMLPISFVVYLTPASPYVTISVPFLQPSQSSSSNHVWVCLKVKQLLELSGSVLGGLDAVADGARILVDLVVVTTLVCLVAEEVDCRVLGSKLLLGLDVLQAVCLVPTSGENIE